MKYTKEKLQEAVAHSKSYREVLRWFGKTKISNSSAVHVQNQINKFGIDTSHFTGQGHFIGKSPKNKLSWEKVLVYNRRKGYREHACKLRRALLESGVPELCSICGQSNVWHGKPLTLQIHHTDGDFLNNFPDNLVFLCPNCRTQTDTHSRNRDMLELVDKTP